MSKVAGLLKEAMNEQERNGECVSSSGYFHRDTVRDLMNYQHVALMENVVEAARKLAGDGCGNSEYGGKSLWYCLGELKAYRTKEGLA